MRQKWFCDACGKKGSVSLAKHEGVWSAVQKLYDEHAKSSPECNPKHMRVVAGRERK